MAAQRVVYTLLILGVLLQWQPALGKGSICEKKEECFFDCGNEFMDLRALKNLTFTNYADKSGKYQFSYSPCAIFSEGVGCKNTHACQVLDIMNASNTMDIGSLETTKTIVTAGPVNYLHYQANNSADGKIRKTKVKVVCGSLEAGAAQLVVDGEDPKQPLLYSMTLTSEYACFQVKGHTSHTPPTTATTHVTHVTTQAHNVTTAVTTQAHNVTTDVTTQAHNVTTAVTTQAHNVTTAVTTPHHTNVTTQAQNVTTAVTTPNHSNMTTPHHGNATTADVTTHGHSVHTTQGHVVTTTSAANNNSGKATLLTMASALLITFVFHL